MSARVFRPGDHVWHQGLREYGTFRRPDVDGKGWVRFDDAPVDDLVLLGLLVHEGEITGLGQVA